jgi:hypothetical protein
MKGHCVVVGGVVIGNLPIGGGALFLHCFVFDCLFTIIFAFLILIANIAL